ncbi:preprotein translocase subunit YajC [Clostridioides mangenotii]|uniref:preprotein translocase subunit YajC n=1 Tax=Metaclostridioides mangenotii TaxID=1540 RepID=UPI001C120841|nr:MULTISPECIES: preprotein translocase subunit YajC [Clostridioides]MBS5787792.1 preprotein translocase subunit YajC [Clostridioides difficile]MBU5306885.1 preprotein translocase subunit YajC [Clostridioides mangenotii]MCR1954304.1 preprotein translocase subunit YajC [Clostridioides mangenotii]
MPQQSLLPVIAVWVVVFGLFYFLLMRPQKKRDKQLKEMRESLQVGDKVTTIGGIIATVAKVDDDNLTLEIGPSRTKVPFQRWAIGTVESKKEEVEVKEDKEEK